jgi:hypothetical protein
MNASDVVDDLVEGRYVCQNLKNQETGIDFHATDLNDNMFLCFCRMSCGGE